MTGLMLVTEPVTTPPTNFSPDPDKDVLNYSARVPRPRAERLP